MDPEYWPPSKRSSRKGELYAWVYRNQALLKLASMILMAVTVVINSIFIWVMK